MQEGQRLEVFETNMRMCMNEKVVSLSLLRWLRLSKRREERDSKQTCMGPSPVVSRPLTSTTIDTLS